MNGLLLFSAVAVLATVAGVLAVARRRVREHGLFLIAWRWLTGEPLHGRPVTDAGWNRPGTRAFTPTGHARRWWYRRRRYRAAWRSGPTLGAVLAFWGLAVATVLTLAVLSALAVVGLVLGGWAVVLWVRRRKHRRTWVQPAHLAAAPLVGLPVAADPASWLEVAPDRSRVVAELPPAWSGDATAKSRLVSTLSSKLAIEAPEVRWMMAGPKPHLEIIQSAPPPSRVSLTDAMGAIEAARPDELVWGPGKRGSWVKSSLSGDSPHIGLSIGSGGGKSETAKSVLVQLLHKGAVGLILDYKMTSHPWATGLPNVVTAVRIAEIHRALVWLGAESLRRREVAYAGTDMHGRVHADVGARLVIVLEELNATVAMLRSYWRETREKSDPVRSPALTALDEVSFTGRSALMNLVYIGQRLSDKATGGGGDARENIGVIAFARYRPSTWKMLAPDFPMPPKTLHLGRLHVVSDQVQEAQGILASTEDARELALSGVVSPLPYGMPGAPRETAATGSRIVLQSVPDQDLATVSDSYGPLAVSTSVTLREAVEAGLLGGLTLAGARTARHRDESFPPHAGRDGVAELYDPGLLAAWAKRRQT